MPQPLTSKRIKTVVVGDTISARPKHAAAALEIITEAALAELGVGKLLVSLSPQNGRELAAHYNSQETDTKKGATVEATAAVLLADADRGLLHRLLAKHKSILKERTPFAHWLYAHTPENEDALILINPKAELLAEAEAMFIAHNWMGEGGESKPTEERLAMLQRRDEVWFAALDKAACYELKELERIVTRLRGLRVCHELFQAMITWKGAQVARDAQFHALERCLHDLDSPTLKVVHGAQTRARSR